MKNADRALEISATPSCTFLSYPLFKGVLYIFLHHKYNGGVKHIIRKMYDYCLSNFSLVDENNCSK